MRERESSAHTDGERAEKMAKREKTGEIEIEKRPVQRTAAAANSPKVVDPQTDFHHSAIVVVLLLLLDRADDPRRICTNHASTPPLVCPRGPR